jgi:hypothetical protein
LISLGSVAESRYADCKVKRWSPIKGIKDNMLIKNPFKARAAKTPQTIAAVLSISDDTATASFVEEHLNVNGYLVYSVPNVPDALAILESGQPIDLIICDFTQPEIDEKLPSARASAAGASGAAAGAFPAGC